MAEVFETDDAWQAVKIGAGGYLTGMDIAADGTMVARTDTYGAYIWNGTSWQQLVTVQSLPAGVTLSGGVYELRIAASNSNILYMEAGDGIFKSVDRGQTWTKTNFPSTSFDPNNATRMDGQKMAIDPTNPNIVFAGTQNAGLWVTRDGGDSWQKITSVPQGTSGGGAGLSGIVINGSTVFVGTAGSGVYTSKDGGYTWSAIGGPADISHAAIGPDGTYYASGNTATALWKYANGTWTKLLDTNAHAITVDPFNPSHLIVTDDGGNLTESKDGGLTWGDGWNWGKQLESSNDVPWLENSGLYMSTGRVLFDPLVQGKLWQSAGVGVWHTQLPSSLMWNTPLVWNSQSAGIEQLVANDIIAPPGGNPVFASWDRAFFEVTDPDTYASGYGGGGFSMGWSVDYASSNPSFIVGISDYWGTENSGFSTDGGATWQKFAGLPSFALNTIGGSIAASSPTNFIWAATGNQAPAYTLDGGKTWASISIPGVTNWGELHHAYYLYKTTITADRVQPNTFYLYDQASGVYRTTDGGVSWTKMHTGPVSDWSYWNSKIEAVPGQAGELYFTSGPLDGDPSFPANVAFMHSTDGGATWQAVPNVFEVHTFGYGAPVSAGGPATIFIVGYVNGDYGIWYSADDAQSWTKIGEHPAGSLDVIKTISGDMDHFGLVYVGFGGSGYAYLNFGDSQPTPPTSTGPSQTSTIVSALDDVGTPATVGSGSIINDATPTLSGMLSSTLTAGQVLVVYRDGQRLMELSPTTRAWKFTDAGAADGTHQYTVRVETLAGQVGSYSSAFSLTVDTQAPTQLVTVIGTNASSGLSGASPSVLTGTTSTSAATPSLIMGNISAGLADGESLVVLRDGVRVGTATVNDGTWTFTDNVVGGSYTYAAQVQDAAGNLGKMSSQYVISVGAKAIYGTVRGDVLIGSDGADQISGVPSAGSKIGKGTIDVLTGKAGADIFVAGDSRGRFYDDGNSRSAGTGDYVRITDFATGDKLQLKGLASEYLQRATTVKGFSGTGIYHDSNRNGQWDSRDELVALIQNKAPLDPDSFIFVGSATPYTSITASATAKFNNGGDIHEARTTLSFDGDADPAMTSYGLLDGAVLDASGMLFIY